ncbi:hypothetical protein [uncultured Dokdonia sp.]|uniref:hypothetical protein n=1 Tax=uncultured Dokdonia sp. TaxID=575653 RepID=UPI002639045D|nr:hypothetical protein [uncultured Dokdonia sp.]
MPKLDPEQRYTKRAYYFGVLALISFLVTRGLISVQRLTATSLPAILIVLIIIVCIFCGIACVYSIYMGRKEQGSPKKAISTFLGLGSVIYIILLIKDLFSVSY